MNQDLNDRVMNAILDTQSTMPDNDQRSAIGMAESYLRTGKAIVRQTIHPTLYARRDDLAERFVEIVQVEDKNDAKMALRLAREYINAPFIDPTMNGQLDGKARIEKPKGANNAEVR